MFHSDLFAHVGVLEAKLIGAVVADRHGSRTQPHDLDLVRVARLGRVGMITSVDGHQGRPHDRVWAVRTHETFIGTPGLGLRAAPQNGPETVNFD